MQEISFHSRDLSWLVPPVLASHLNRQIEFSRRTFGPGARTAGVIDHIRKELVEIEATDGDGPGGVDRRRHPRLRRRLACGLHRQGDRCRPAGEAGKNERRTWPDWRTADPTKAIGHVRGTED